MKAIFNLGLTAVLLCSGCAADRKARSTAEDLTKATLKYEEAVDAKVAAEKTFYHDQLATLRRVLGGNDAITQMQVANKKEKDQEQPPLTVTEEKQLEAVKNTLPYLKLVTAANRDARIAADDLLNSANPPSMTAVLDFIEKGVSSEREEYLDYLEHQRDLLTTLGKNLESIEQQKAKAAALRSALGELAKPKSKLHQTEGYAKFAKEVYDLTKSNPTH